MRRPHPRLVLSGVASGVGKTSLSLGIARALTRRGLRAQAFKVGPDFLDPGYLAMASGRTCYNLDGWMTGRDYVRNLFTRAAADADIAIIEGVMGLFDGASATGMEGSTAEIAAWLDAPVVLAVNVHGMARSVAAIIKGYAQLEPSVKLSGVIANHCGGVSHRLTLAQSLASTSLPPLVGAVPRDALPSLPSRHLGLVTATEASLPEEIIEQLADACEQYLDLDQILAMAKEAPEIEVPDVPAAAPAAGAKTVRIGIARDGAFHFYYPDNLEMLRDLGAELVEFSPLHDRRLPENLGGLYLGGGYPELHAEQLSANGEMLEDLRRFAAAGKCIYAECGGLMYLGRRVTTLEGRSVELAGVLPVDTTMLKNLKALGYVQAQPAAESFWRGNGQVQNLRGHEFHYSDITAAPSPADGWRAAYTAMRRRSGAAAPEGFCKGAIVASYIHLHFGSCPAAAERLVQCCKEKT